MGLGVRALKIPIHQLKELCIFLYSFDISVEFLIVGIELVLIFLVSADESSG